MFLVTCSHCGRAELRHLRSLSSLRNTATGIELVFACTGCGHDAVVHTGRRCGTGLTPAA